MTTDSGDYPDCVYCGHTLWDGDLDTEMCGECHALFEIEDGVIRFEGGEEVRV